MDKREVIILVVEDDVNDLDLIQRCLRKVAPDFCVTAVNNGLDAIAYMMGEKDYADRRRFPYPTFIMTDLKMPGADGFAVLEHLKANPSWAIIPTVVLSASEDQDDIRTAYLLGASSYHSKPPSFDALLSQIKVLCDYWMTCLIPEADTSGKQLRTESKGKLGERFPQPTTSKQTRVKHS